LREYKIPSILHKLTRRIWRYFLCWGTGDVGFCWSSGTCWDCCCYLRSRRHFGCCLSRPRGFS